MVQIIQYKIHPKIYLIILYLQIEDQKPNCEVAIRNPMRGKENAKANKVAESVDNLIKVVKIRFTDNNIIREKHL